MEYSKTVSVITPVYNAAAYITDTLKSLEAQTYEDWELILIDDGSSDRSVLTVLEHFGAAYSEEGLEDSVVYSWKRPQRVLLIALKKNVGAATSRNTGLAYAEGRYLAFLDSDDLWQREKLAKQIAFLHDHQAVFTFTAYEFGDAAAKGTGKVVHVPETLVYREALSRTIIFTSTVLFDMEKLSKEMLKMPRIFSEDTATWWSILKKGITAYGLDENLTIYRRPQGGSLSSNKFHALWRIWNLYREWEGMGILESIRYFIPWAVYSTLRRI
ncbi:MAG: glycosyltransferase family 2 protein [Lachnospiraceae bacterium]|nr:glycosyltransferase family 2 protein [Lachnospiraceae bacterium]